MKPKRPNPTRILAVTNQYPTAEHPNVGTYVYEQIKGLRDAGLSIDVLFLDRRREGKVAYLNLSRRLKATLLQFRPEIVHVMYGGILADRVTRIIRDRPTIVSFCGSDLLGGVLSGIVNRFGASCGVVASHRAAKRANGIIVKSKNLQEALPLNINPGKVRIIPNGIDLTLFRQLDRGESRRDLDWRRDTFHILSPAGNDPRGLRKRNELAISSAELLRNDGQRVEVHLLRGVRHSDVPIWLNASNVLLLTSVHEGSPNIVKEALACNIPVVSVDVGDVKERILNIPGCFLTSPHPAEIAARLQDVQLGLDRIDGKNAVQNFSLEAISYRLWGFYQEIYSSYLEPRGLGCAIEAIDGTSNGGKCQR